MELLFAGIALLGFFGGLALLKSALARLEPHLGPWLRTGINSSSRAFFAGLALTVVIQSSSATNVMVVALVAAGVFDLRRAFGVVLGANVGTTVTGQIVAFGTLELGLVLLGAALALQLPPVRIIPLGKLMRLGEWGEALGGLGCVFASLWCVGRLLQPLVDGGNLTAYVEAITSSQVAALGFGVVVTAIVQSSSAVTGLVIGWVDSGGLPVSAGIAAALGSNIGTVATTILASVSSGYAARRLAVADMLFNVLGVLLVWPAIGYFEAIVRTLSLDPGRQIAHAHTLFNVITAVAVFPFLTPFCRLVERLVPSRRNG